MSDSLSKLRADERREPPSEDAESDHDQSGSKLLTEEAAASWTIEDAFATYNIDRWGLGYFSINEKGNVSVAPLQEAGPSLDVMEVIREAQSQNLQFPMVIRFQDLLRHRVETLNRAFNDAIKEYSYKSNYRGVFPIKVNQLREVVEEIVDAGRPFHYGLEAGSKPELFAALAIHEDPESFIICNGYKDTPFIRMALSGQRLGKNVILVAEKVEEVKAIVTVAREMGVEPWVGMRVRLLAKSTGTWATSGGENAKFGLSTADLMEALEFLKEQGKEDCFKLLHFHIGSQVPDISSIKRATREAARYYAKLRKMGFNVEIVDVGGGLGVDYDGSRTSFHSSTNYSLREYAADTVYNLADVCDEEGVPHPIIVSESGRAIVAHHSLLVVQAFGTIEKTKASYDLTVSPGDHKWVRELAEIRETYRLKPREALHDIQHIREQAQSAFDLGILDLRTKAKIETFYWATSEDIIKLFQQNSDLEVPEEIAELNTSLADQYLCNFSVFQSLLDHWALGQVFPIMPIHRLSEAPLYNGTIVDITCDSDGKVSKFADVKDVRAALPMHPLKAGEPYYLGFFMTGAYQDIMGDMHNLFGRVNEAHVFLDEDEEGSFYIEETLSGASIAQVLELTQYHTHDLSRRMKAQIDRLIKDDRIKPNEGMRILAEYERGLLDSTYLSLDKLRRSPQVIAFRRSC